MKDKKGGVEREEEEGGHNSRKGKEAQKELFKQKMVRGDEEWEASKE